MCVRVCVHLYLCVDVSTCVYMRVCVCVCECVHVYMCVSVLLTLPFIYVHMDLLQSLFQCQNVTFCQLEVTI